MITVFADPFFQPNHKLKPASLETWLQKSIQFHLLICRSRVCCLNTYTNICSFADCFSILFCLFTCCTWFTSCNEVNKAIFMLDFCFIRTNGWDCIIRARSQIDWFSGLESFPLKISLNSWDNSTGWTNLGPCSAKCLGDNGVRGPRKFCTIYTAALPQHTWSRKKRGDLQLISVLQFSR